MPVQPLPSDTSDPNDELEVPFDPDEFAVVVEHHDEGLLGLHGDPEDSIREFTARVYPHLEGQRPERQPSDALARVEFQLIEFSQHVNDGDGEWPGQYDFGDSVSSDLLEVAKAIYAEDGDPREDLDFGMPGSDLVYISMIETKAGPEGYELARYLIEYVLERYCHSFMCAVYYQANWESIGVARPLKDRGFQQTPTNRNIWFVDLGRTRPRFE